MKNKITNLARSNRSNATKSEKAFWERVRNRQWEGTKWVRQKPIVYEEIMGEKHFLLLIFIALSINLLLN